MSRDPLRLPETPKEHEEFRTFVNDFVVRMEARDERIKENAEIFQKKYGIKYCPFHTPGLVEEVEHKSRKIKFYGTNHKFTYLNCATWNLCQSNVSFDKGLIKKIRENEKLIEVKLRSNTKCITCGSDKGKAYFTGLEIPIDCFGEGGRAVPYGSDTIDTDNNKLYLFDRPCHSYLVANFGGVDLELKNPPKNPFLNLRRIYLKELNEHL